MRFQEGCEFKGDPSEVWARVSNLEAIPAYWHGTKEIRITRSEDKIKADVVFAFGGKGKAELIVDERDKTMTINYLEGPFKGRQSVSVRDNIVQAEWDVTFKGALRVLGPWNERHFRSGTRNALKRLSAVPEA